MIQPNEAGTWRGRSVVDRSGGRIGKIDEIFLDDASRPKWALVGLGTRSAFAPLTGAHEDGDRIVVAFTREEVERAPAVAVDANLSPGQERALHEHYRLDRDTGPSTANATRPVDVDLSGMRQSDASAHEEQPPETGPPADDQDIASGDTTTGYSRSSTEGTSAGGDEAVPADEVRKRST